MMPSKESKKDKIGLIVIFNSLFLIPIIILALVFVSPINNESELIIDDEGTTYWDIGSGYRFGIKIFKFVETAPLEGNIGKQGEIDNQDPSVIEQEQEFSKNDEFTLVYSFWSDQELIIDNNISTGEWPVEYSVLNIQSEDISAIDFGAQNNDETLFLLFIFNWITEEDKKTVIETDFIFQEYSLSKDDKIVIKFSLEKKDQELIPERGNIQLKMVQTETHDNSEKTNQDQIDIEAYRKRLYERIDLNRNKINDELDERILRSQEAKLEKIIVVCKRGSVNRVLEKLNDLGGDVFNVWDQNEGIIGFSGSLLTNQIENLARFPDIEMIEENKAIIPYADDATRLTQLRTQVWDTMGYHGDNNNSIAILDSGLDDSHPILNGYSDKAFENNNFKIVGWYDASGEGSTTPEDYGGHGSHCGSIAAGLPYDSTVSGSDNRLATTWSTHYQHTGGGGSGSFSYVIDIRSTGTVDIDYYWSGDASNHGDFLRLLAPNGSLLANDTSGSSTMSISISISETGLHEVQLGLTVGTDGDIGMTGVNKYPYEDLGDGHSRVMGVAPDTKLVGVKVFDRNGTGWADDTINGIKWIINNSEDYHITIASMSLGFSGTVGAVDLEIVNLLNKGVLPVIAAGNDGQGSGNKIFSPGQVDAALTVAASGDTDSLTDYSSEGPGATSTTTKPDVTAPGGHSSEGAYLMMDSNDSDAGNDGESGTPSYADRQADDLAPMQGTSMACPHVAGIASLLVQAMGGFSTWQFNDTSMALKIKQIISLTTHEIYDTQRGLKDKYEGYGRVNADAAINALISSYSIGSSSSETLSGAQFGKKVWARKVNLEIGHNYTFTVDVPTGMDYDIYLYHPNPTVYGEPQLIANSTNTNAGAQESFSYFAQYSGEYFITVKFVSGTGSGQFSVQSSSEAIPGVYIQNPLEKKTIDDEITIQVATITETPETVSSVKIKWRTDSWINITSDYNGVTKYYERTINTSQFFNGILLINASMTDSASNSYSIRRNVTISNPSIGQVLLVDDDGGESYETYYQAALDSLDISYHTICYSPTAEEMAQYNAVVWFTGDDYSTTLTASDQSELGTYLDDGGSLFLSGQDICYNLGDGNSFTNNYLKVNYNKDDTNEVKVVGRTGTIFEGKIYNLGGGDGAGNNNYPDDITVQTGGVDALRYKLINSQERAGVTYSGTWKVVFLAFAYESINTASERLDMMNVTSSFLGVTPDNDPVVSITNPTAEIIKGTFLLEWSGDDDNGISYYHIFVDGISQGTTTSTSMNIQITNEFQHTLRLVAFDALLQKAIDSYTFTVDNTPPNITLNSPTNGSTNPGGTIIDISFDGTEDVVLYRWDTEVENSTTLLPQPSEVGEHSLEVYTNDSVGNWEHKHYVFHTPVPEFAPTGLLGVIISSFAIITIINYKKRRR